ncbi:hypothetical protein [Amycolatopsis sp. H20-H5]|uniref:hypothetical protein n=1 Tax=Amycolatopsis sp. H20-H5 TaxID=3046309 RepID=UPI002DB939ED|nr:hypothetical protein [Amycolatopsis sp. H20-H5]MEC3980344.1 hypothetical protein [Amycolatopsis sp. H20-H5]
MLPRRRATVLVAVVAALAWVVSVTAMIAHQPSPGVPSAEVLRQDLTAALSAHDASALENLLDYPPGQASDFAASYVKTLETAGAHDLAVTLSPGTATVSGVLRDGTRFTYPVAVSEKDGLWTVTFAPPLPG